jgi:hypothetical protein
MVPKTLIERRQEIAMTPNRPTAPVTRKLLIAICLSAASFTPALAADGLRLEPMPRWQARVQLNSLDDGGAAHDGQPHTGSRLLSANLLGDYYLTGSGLGGVQGGLRATGGMLMGPLSLLQSSSGLALGTNAFQFGRRSLSLHATNQEGGDANATLSYLGIGYTGHALRSRLSFSADLGVVNNTDLGGLRLGRSSVGVEAVLRDMRYKPVLQLGLSYDY